MDKALGMHSTTFENVILLASRLLLAWIFVHEEFFSDEIFAKGRGPATIYIPCDGPIETIGRIRPYQSPEVELATIVHAGSHRSIDLAYGALATHVARHERAADGPLRELYLVGPLDTSDESAWRTEIGWPIVKD